ncbi:hypothetical protein [Streptomyces lydicus]|uniref:hypothetical protein n=1 Tax=Streptomyces lydicus TaxID=47763 RepID=UPI00372211FC
MCDHTVSLVHDPTGPRDRQLVSGGDWKHTPTTYAHFRCGRPYDGGPGALLFRFYARTPAVPRG